MTHEFRHSDESVEHYTPIDVVEAEHDVLGSIELDPASCAAANVIVGAARYYSMSDDGFSREWRARTVHLNPPGGKCDVTGRPIYAATKKRRSCLETGACGLPPGRREGDKLIPGHKHTGVTSSAKAWWFKLAAAYVEGRVGAAFFVAFNLDIFQTTQIGTPRIKMGREEVVLPTPLDFDFCIPSGRLEYLSESGGRIAPGESPTHASAVVLVSRNAELREAFRVRFSDFGKVVRVE